MGTYASASNVQARLPGSSRTIGASTDPSTTDVNEYIADAEALLTGALDAAQIDTPVTSTTGTAILQAWVTDYAEARTRKAWASAGGDGGNDDGRDELERFDERLKDITDNPQKYEAMLTGGAATNSKQVRSYTLDNQDGKTIEAGDFDPIFERDDAF